MRPSAPAAGRVLVLGTGISGRSMSSWCLRLGHQVVAGDPAGAAAGELDPRVQYLPGPATNAWLEGVDRVLISPGIPPRSSQVGKLLQAARAKGIGVASELDLFTEALNQLAESRGYHPQVVAITGTNGKTTTTLLTTKMLNASGRSALAAGNLGPALLETLAAALDAESLPEIWVLELSSFQLTYGEDFQPTIGVLLNITADHLDWHSDFDEYSGAKSRVLTAATVVACRDDPVVARKLDERGSVGRTLTIGVRPPSTTGDYGIADASSGREFVRFVDDGHRERIVEVAHVGLRGDHLLVDALAAVAVTDHLGADRHRSLGALAEYRGEPHRTEPVGSIGGVVFIDDSKATNVGATLAALASCNRYEQVVLILGGEAKGQDFAALRSALPARVGTVVTMGRAAPQIERALHGTGLAVKRAADMSDAVSLAAHQARPGDAVLLSPACASTDWFADYAERGRFFRQAVARLVDFDNSGDAACSAPATTFTDIAGGSQ